MRYGNDYLILLGEETSYGTEQTSYTAILPDKITMKREVAQITTSQKSYSYEKQKNELKAGIIGGSVEISGELGYDGGLTRHGILLAAFFDSGTAFSNPTIGTAKKSYTIYQYFSDGKVNKAVGCVLESLNISGNYNETIKYTATFRAKDIDFESTVTLTAPTYPEVRPFLFCNVKATVHGSADKKINSFDLQLKNIMADDKIIYQNSCYKSGEYKVAFEGTLKIQKTYDESLDKDIIDDTLDDSLVYDKIELDDGANSWEFETYGKVTETNLPDPEKAIFEFDFTKELLADNTHRAIEIST